MRKADIRVGAKYFYDGCTEPGTIVTIVDPPRYQGGDGWVANGTTANVTSVAAYLTRWLEPA